MLFRLLLSLLIFFAAPVAVAKEVLIPTDKVAGAGDGRFFLLSIGVGTFQDDFWPTLKWPKTDAAKVAAGVGRDTELTLQAEVLTDKAATRAGVLKALDRIRRKATARDTVVVYVSSHGTLAEGDNGELEKVVVLNDTTKDRPLLTGLGHRDLADWLESLPARRKLLIFATCNSGVGKSRLSPRVERLLSSTKGHLAPLADVSEGALILAAAAKGEAAREDDRLQGDIYTHYLLEGLTTYDRNRDGVVTALEAHDYAKERTYAHTGGRQRPTADARLIGDADVPLRGVRKRSGLPVLEAYDEDLAGFQVQVDGGVKGRLPLAFPLDKDGSRVSLYAPQSGKKLAEYSVEAKGGQTVTLAEIMAPPPYDLGLAAGQETWGDSAFKRLAGTNHLTFTEAEAKYHWWNFFAGASGRFPVKGSNEIRTALKAKVQYDAVLLYAGYGLSFAGAWRLWGQAGLGEEWLKLSFADSAGGESLSFGGKTLLYGGQLGVERELGSFYLSLKAGRLYGHYGRDALGDLGTLNAERTLWGLGLNYHFGGVAKRL